mmetsp:Transcript_26553/g.65991  ORF Transcript_26553/g.65991 Transcript_26553/m.65991 type:complete len:285 (-) Transcript_26553:318-1172(-)
MYNCHESVLLLLDGVVGRLHVVHPHHLHTAMVVACHQHRAVQRETNRCSPTVLTAVCFAGVVDHHGVEDVHRQIPHLHTTVRHGSRECCGVVRRPCQPIHGVKQIRRLEGGDRPLSVFERPQLDGPVGGAAEKRLRPEVVEPHPIHRTAVSVVGVEVLLVVGCGAPVDEPVLGADQVGRRVAPREVHAHPARLAKYHPFLDIGASESWVGQALERHKQGLLEALLELPLVHPAVRRYRGQKLAGHFVSTLVNPLEVPYDVGVFSVAVGRYRRAALQYGLVLRTT